MGSEPDLRRMSARRKPAATLATALIATILASFSATDGAASSPAASAPAARLATTPSPYLREHADNLVAWRTWGPEAFAEARATGKPVFLSIGYMACHWCHVMEEKNFMNPEIAAFINAHFIPVLVDRERRPGVDETYMLATEVLTGHGGWPNNLFLTPDLEPFFAGVYIPPGRFLRILRGIERAWRQRPQELRAEAARVSALLRRHLSRRHGAGRMDKARFLSLAHEVAARFDAFHGGLGTGPKHFRAPVLMMLARAALVHDDEASGTALLNTLRHVVRAGVMDHLEGGFFRYAVDGQWNIPHFEKMLYTQAQMAMALLAGWRISGEAELAGAARRTLDYALSDLRAPDGGFYSARDADGPGGEGAFYIWTKKEIMAALGPRDGARAIALFGTVPYGELAGRIIITLEDAASVPAPWLASVLRRLKTARAARPRPMRDEKIITAWNGLMISALARAAMILDDKRYASAAEKTARMILRELRDERGNLLRSRFGVSSALPATLADHAFLIAGLLDLHDLTGDDPWLHEAEDLARRMDERLWDEKAGGYWFTQGAAGFARPRLSADGALPAAQAVALDILARLERRTGAPHWRTRAETLASTLLAAAEGRPVSHAASITAADALQRGETGPVSHAGGGVARIIARLAPLPGGGMALHLRLRLRPGWHVNAANPPDENQVPTRLLPASPGLRLARLRYPPATKKRLAFSDKPLSLLEGTIGIDAGLRGRLRPPVRLRLQLQACSEELCLQPERPPVWALSPAPPAPASAPGR